MKGAILQKGEKHYTYMKGVFSAIRNAQLGYNWLITNCECYPQTKSFYELLTNDNYCWLSGSELTSLVEKEDFQWIWAVLSGVDKSMPVEEVLKYDLPYADGYAGFWENPITIQHPLDIKAGRVRPANEFFNELERKHSP